MSPSIALNSPASSENLPPLPRPGSVLYNVAHPHLAKSKQTLRRFKFMNKWVVIPLYRARLLPLFGFGRLFLLLRTKGRKSHKYRYTPVEYHKINGVIHVFASRGQKSDWYKNILAFPDEVVIQLGFRTHKVRPEVISDVNEQLEVMKWYVTHHPKYAASLFGWDPRYDSVEKTDLTPIVSLIKIIRLHIPSNS